MIAFPNAKVNLGLNILSRRPDGYHNLSSCFVPISWCDILEIIKANRLSFASTGLDIPGEPNSNLVIKAYEMLRKEYDLSPVRIHLHKVIPMGAGLGGGSSDAAFALRLLDSLFELGLSHTQLEAYATQLGADCPFFIQNKTQLVSGIGEIFDPIDIDLQGYQMQLVYPGVHVNTGQVFGAITPQAPLHFAKDLLSLPISEWKGKLTNDFEAPVFDMHPELAHIKAKMYQSGAHYAAMSGSGSTVYGLFDQGVQLTESRWLSYIHVF